MKESASPNVFKHINHAPSPPQLCACQIKSCHPGRSNVEGEIWSPLTVGLEFRRLDKGLAKGEPLTEIYTQKRTLAVGTIHYFIPHLSQVPSAALHPSLPSPPPEGRATSETKPRPRCWRHFEPTRARG